MSAEADGGGGSIQPRSGPGLAPRDPGSRPKNSERLTRKPLPWWDRIKIIALLSVVLGIVVWADVVNHKVSIGQAIGHAWWVLALIAIEAIRQIHYLFAEWSSRYHKHWDERIFGSVNQRTDKMNDWTRFRLARALKYLTFLALVSIVLGAVFHEPPVTALFHLPVAIAAGMPFILQLAFGFFFVIFQFVGLFWFLSKGGVDTHMPDDIDTRFTDVKGQDAVLKHVKENMIFLDDPESIEERGGYVPGGILLYGPPGTGKTLMAQAVAGETAKPFVFVDPGAFIQMFMGVGILKVKSLYRKLRKLALRYGGVIVFFDEADSLGNRGGVGGQQPGGPGGGIEQALSPWAAAPPCNGLAYASPNAREALLMGSLTSASRPPERKEGIIAGLGGMGGGGMGTLQALLSEMSGLTKPRGFVNRHVRRVFGLKPKPPPKYRILHIFATNRPDVLDEALVRPGRIDRKYKVGYPLKEGRKATFEYYFAKVTHELTDEQMEKLAVISPYATGASIQDMVNESLIIALREGRQAITWRDIIEAKRIKQHGLPDDHEYIERERHSVAVHEACHAVVAYRLRRHVVIDLATIERRGDIGGFVSSIPPEDQFVEWRSERETDVMTFLASLAGERMFFDGDHSTGVGGDMRGATALTTQMSAYYAMGGTIAARSINLGSMNPFAQPVETGEDRAFFDSHFGEGVEAKLEELYERTWALLEENRAEVLAVAHALEIHKTLTGDDVAAIIEGREGPLTDGRPYRDAGLIAALESYHDRALVALKEHSKVDSPLPELVGAVSASDEVSGNGKTGREPDKEPPTLAG